MSRRLVLSTFEREEDILAATRAARTVGFTIAEVYAPYAVHGMEEALALRPSRLPWVCFIMGAIAAPATVWFEYWATWLNWPINVGGKPWNSLPAFMPVIFEMTVLSAGIGTFVALFLACRLWLGKSPAMPAARVTDDQFLLVIEETNAAFDWKRARLLMENFNAVHIEERIEEAR